MQRNTTQRRAIHNAIQDANRPLSAEDILSLAKDEIPSLGIATVYRELRRLQDEHSVVLVQLPGDVPRYEASGKQHHHHFKCLACETVFDIEGCTQNVSLGLPTGFTHESHEITIFGKCNACNTAAVKNIR